MTAAIPRVSKFTPRMLEKLLVGEGGKGLSNEHKNYFKKYFEKMDAKSIIIEDEYIDRDFLEDFANYYVRCFQNHPRKCKRLHFFSQNIVKKDIVNLLDGKKDQRNVIRKLQASYLGFIVVKPLPQTYIGRTCIKTYKRERGKERYYPILRQYAVNLLGVPLSVETLAFQEQDQVASACATSALWSAFHGTGILFHHSIPSPSEITKAAGQSLSLSRTFPSRGLNAPQMAQAIRSINLEPLTFGSDLVSDDLLLKSVLYAYLRGGVPVIMGVDLIDLTEESGQQMLGTSCGLHAVTVTGYRLMADHPTSNAQLSLKSSRIDRIFAHDDQIGPFTRMLFESRRIQWDGGKNNYAISTDWPNEHEKTFPVKAVPAFVMIPLYHKIRITVSSVLVKVDCFDDFIKNVLRDAFPSLPAMQVDGIEWDVYLMQSSELKKELLKLGGIKKEARQSVICRNLPRFLWRATALRKRERLMDLLFDTTDIDQGILLLHAIEYDQLLCGAIRLISQSFKSKREWRGISDILQWFDS